MSPREVIPGLLSWAPAEDAPKDDSTWKSGVSFCEKDGDSRGYVVTHYAPQASGLAYGPLDLENTVRFVVALEQKLSLWQKRKRTSPLVVYTEKDDIAAHANVGILMGAYLIWQRSWTVPEVMEKLGSETSDICLPCSWLQERKANGLKELGLMKVSFCWQGFELAKRFHWVDHRCFSDGFFADLVCSQYQAMLTAFDAAWIVPNRLLVCADPTTTAEDPNPATFKHLFPLASDSNLEDGVNDLVLGDRPPGSPERRSDNTPNSFASDGSGRNAQPVSPLGLSPASRQFSDKDLLDPPQVILPAPTTTPSGPGFKMSELDGLPSASGQGQPASTDRVRVRPAPVSISAPAESRFYADPTSPGGRTELDSTASVNKDYFCDDRAGSLNVNGLEKLSFVKLLEEQGVGMVVRANFPKESGMISASYSARQLKSYGIDHLDVPFGDYNGAVPPANLIEKTLKAAGPLVEANQAVCVHCKGGFGRSVILICCLAIHVLDVPGDALLGWVRVTRPGAITTLDQERFLCSLTGRAALTKLLKGDGNQACCTIA